MLIKCFDCISKPQKGGNSRIKVDFYCTGAAVGDFLNTCFTKLFFFQYNLQIIFLVCALKQATQTTALGLDPFSGPRVSGRGWLASTQLSSLPAQNRGELPTGNGSWLVLFLWLSSDLANTSWLDENCAKPSAKN